MLSTPDEKFLDTPLGLEVSFFDSVLLITLKSFFEDILKSNLLFLDSEEVIISIDVFEFILFKLPKALLTFLHQ